MPDGSTVTHAYPLAPGELIVDLFAGGGGASEGIFEALGRHPDIAINHDPEAIAVHTRNHPTTRHYCQSIWKVHPLEAVGDSPVGLLHASPDCRHFSRAAGGRPKWKSVRSLPGVVLTWAKYVRPKIITVENVPEMIDWGPLLDDGTPCPKRIGRSFKCWAGRLRGMGYKVEWRKICAADFGVPTIRTRLFIIARCDGPAPAWPQPTHHKIPGLFGEQWRGASEIIDWSLPCPSIFERKRPLKEATCRRIAEGIMRYVVNAAEPFLVHTAHGEVDHTGKRRGKGSKSIQAPLATLTTSQDSALVIPHISSLYGRSVGADVGAPLGTVTAHAEHHALVSAHISSLYGTSTGSGIDAPLGAVTAQGQHHALVAAHLTPITHQGPRRGSGLDEPVPTLTCAHRGEHALVAAFMAQHNGGNAGHSMQEPVSTLLSGGHHQQVVEATLEAGEIERAQRVTAFLIHYYGSGKQGQHMREPLGAVPTHGRFGLVMCRGVPLTDICMRMLAPHELQAAQGFRPDYDLTDGGRLTKTTSIRLIGNSVCPGAAAAVIRANVTPAPMHMLEMEAA